MDIGANKYTVAWFKLAEFVSRREKEKALGIFKLLSHSLGDKGLELQLRGDIFLSFSDIESAKKSYLEAAKGYVESGSFLSGAAIYEHLMMLDSSDVFEYSFNMLELYSEVGNMAKQFKAIKYLIACLSTERDVHKLEESINSSSLCKKDKLFVYESVVLGLLEAKRIARSSLYRYIELIIDGLGRADAKKLDDFCFKLESVDSEAHKHALAYFIK